MCVNNLSKVALDSAAVGFEPATSSRKSNALTGAPPSYTVNHGSAWLEVWHRWPRSKVM